MVRDGHFLCVLWLLTLVCIENDTHVLPHHLVSVDVQILVSLGPWVPERLKNHPGLENIDRTGHLLHCVAAESLKRSEVRRVYSPVVGCSVYFWTQHGYMSRWSRQYS